MNKEDERSHEAVEKSGAQSQEPAMEEVRDIAEKLGLSWIDKIEIDSLDRDLISRTSFQFAKANLLLPMKIEDGELLVASANPLNVQQLDDLKLIYAVPVKIIVASANVVMEAVNKVYDLSADSANQIIDDIEEDENLDDLVSGLPVDLLETSAEAPVIRLVNSILMQAAKEKASDIHFESYERELAVRFRIDGTLKNIISPPKRLQSLIVSRVKIMAGLDIAEKRLPQDGRLKIIIAGKEIDVRVSVIPTSHGERVVMRLLDKTTMLLNFEQIGMSEDISARLKKLISLPHGVILVSGPTGSGKTTTLYAALSHINSPDKNIITVEDPVEYQLSGIGQMPVNTKIGLTFASGLRSILRQDPDVIMVGEIRDQETAQMGIQASLTGHLVFSTIHTNDAAGAITRLIDMGIEPFLISSSLTATLAQRLVRVLCPACKIAYEPSKEHLVELGLLEKGIDANTKFYRPNGCELCKMLGYRGRAGVFELLIIDDEIRSLIVQKADSAKVKQAAISRGFVTMRENGAKAVISGLTSLEEVVRVTLDAD